MFKKKKNIYKLLKEYELYYQKLETKTNNLRALYTQLKLEEDNLKEIVQNNLLEIKYAKFIKQQDISLEEKNYELTSINLQEIQSQNEMLEKALSLVYTKLQTIKLYINRIKLNIEIMETFNTNENLNNIEECYIYLKQEIKKGKNNIYEKK